MPMLGDVKTCSRCGKEMVRRKYYSPKRWAKMFYCSKKCAHYFTGESKQRIKAKSGYILTYAPRHPKANKKGLMPYHRIVMEKSLGRLLTKDEHIHHINGIKDDNRIENLVIMSKSEHHKLHAIEYWKERERIGLNQHGKPFSSQTRKNRRVKCQY